MLHVCHAVMFKQLSAWLLHGLLLDYYDEFFVMMVKSNAGTLASSEQSGAEENRSEEKQIQVCFAGN